MCSGASRASWTRTSSGSPAPTAAPRSCAPTWCCSPPAPGRSTRPSTGSTTSASTTRTRSCCSTTCPAPSRCSAAAWRAASTRRSSPRSACNVSLIDSKERLLPFLDAELSHAMQDLFAMASIDLHHRTRALKLEAGEKDVLVTLADGSRLVAEKVLVASGRVGNVEALNLPAAGLKATERGLLEVGPHSRPRSRTSTPPATWSASRRSPRRPWSRRASRCATRGRRLKQRAPTCSRSASTRSPR